MPSKSKQHNVGVVLRPGDKGRNVERMQKRLRQSKAVDKDKIKVDGVYGPATGHQVRKFQSAKGLKPDAVVGPSTWKKLGFHWNPPKGRLLYAQGTYRVRPSLENKLKAVAQDIGHDILVKSGSRTQAQCDQLYARYRAGGPLAASPRGCGGHCCSNHYGAPGKGAAADCGTVINGQYRSIGYNAAARAAMHKHGLVLAVQSEAWHVEEVSHGGVWRYPAR